MVGSPFSFLGRGGVAAQVLRPESVSGVLSWALGSVSAGLLWSSVVVGSFVWFLLNDRIHPAVIYCLKLFLVA